MSISKSQKTLSLLSREPRETVRLGTRMGRHLRPGDVICLFGALGTGKTTFVKGIAQGLRISGDDVVSPTFTLMNIYEGSLPLYHFDFYRLDEKRDILSLGIDEFLYGQGVAVIEWADRMGGLIPKDSLTVRFTHHGGSNGRAIRLSAKGARYQRVLGAMGDRR